MLQPSRLVWAAAAGLIVILIWWAARPQQGRAQADHTRKPLPSPEEIAMLPPDGGPEFNRLIHEKSPYLLQHARNPVDWYPWGPDASAKAKKEDKPIFLSIGYSTCHWCHVMAHESFEDNQVAKLVNEHFVAVKVDREERPDIDEIYMSATQLLTQRGGWPNSVWLTPDGRPWYAGTYFPREDRPGRPGFKTILMRLAEIWRTRRTDVEKQADRLAAAMKQISHNGDRQEKSKVSRDLVTQAIEQLRDSFDERSGGFGSAPKFPPHSGLALLIHEYRRTKDASALNMLTRTLKAMARGGIHDHLGGGFHRYSTDARWLVPHFEKMLYDNAQLCRAYVDAYLITGDEQYRRVAVGIFEWVLREMTDGQGGFYSALDADSEGEEGKFYLWKHDEIVTILGKEEGELFCRVHGVANDGNFRDEATGEKPGTNIIYLASGLDEIAKAEGVEVPQLRARLERDRAKLATHRSRRVRPHLDDKVLAGWNGLMIGGLAYGGRHLGESRYTKAASKAAEFILNTMRKDGRLLRAYRQGQAKLNAYLDDYAFLAEGLLELYEATGQDRWLGEARALMDVLHSHYRDEDGGGFYFTADDHEDLLIRSKDPFDKAIPSGNGTAARVLVRLAGLTEDERYLETATRSFDAFQDLMQRAPSGMTSMITAAAMYLDATSSPSAVAKPATSGEASAGPRRAGPVARARKKPVTAEAFAARLKAGPGQIVRLDVRITIDEGWHINSNKPLQGHLVPTSIELGQDPTLSLGQIVYPEGKQVIFAFSPKLLSVYEGQIKIAVPVAIAKDAKPGPAPAALKLHIQACNDRNCLEPETLTLSLPFEIRPNGGS